MMISYVRLREATFPLTYLSLFFFPIDLGLGPPSPLSQSILLVFLHREKEEIPPILLSPFLECGARSSLLHSRRVTTPSFLSGLKGQSCLGRPSEGRLAPESIPSIQEEPS